MGFLIFDWSCLVPFVKDSNIFCYLMITASMWKRIPNLGKTEASRGRVSEKAIDISFMCSKTLAIHQPPVASYMVTRRVYSVCQSYRFFFQFQSCPVGRGPEFSRSVFDVYGHSPLVQQFLRMRKLSKDCGTSVLIQRTEIKSLPPYPFSYRKLQS